MVSSCINLRWHEKTENDNRSTETTTIESAEHLNKKDEIREVSRGNINVFLKREHTRFEDSMS